MDKVKLQILDEIEKHSSVFKKINSIRYRIRCPLCGDSQKDLNDAHCYIKCDVDNPNEPLLYICFLCNKSGRVDKHFLEMLDVDKSLIFKLSNQRYSKLDNIKCTNIDIITGDTIMNSPQTSYIEHRLGKGLNKDDYDKFKIIWNINTIIPYISDIRIKNTLPCNIDSITFLSDDKTMLLSRAFYDVNGDRWRKIKFIQTDSKSFYTIKSTINLFTQEPIVVNIAEGILDVLSIYKNFTDTPNSIYIAALGSNYISALEYMMCKGFVGSNVQVRIYIDNDDKVNESDLKIRLKKYKWIFESIHILKNIKSKDVGVKIDQIKLVDKKV